MKREEIIEILEKYLPRFENEVRIIDSIADEFLASHPEPAQEQRETNSFSKTEIIQILNDGGCDRWLMDENIEKMADQIITLYSNSFAKTLTEDQIEENSSDYSQLQKMKELAMQEKQTTEEAKFNKANENVKSTWKGHSQGYYYHFIEGWEACEEYASQSQSSVFPSEEENNTNEFDIEGGGGVTINEIENPPKEKSLYDKALDFIKEYHWDEESLKQSGRIIPLVATMLEVFAKRYVNKESQLKQGYPKPFVLWLIFGNHPFVQWYDSPDECFFTDEVDDKKWTLDDLLKYWIDNVKDK
jgi:hypothetical protein